MTFDEIDRDVALMFRRALTDPESPVRAWFARDALIRQMAEEYATGRQGAMVFDRGAFMTACGLGT